MCLGRGVLSQKASFFEAEISWPAVKEPADNQMIEHVDLQNPGSFAEAASQPHIGFTGSRVPSYTGSGITGAMPYPILCRVGQVAASNGAFFDAA
jgi:hypothetical protein